MGHLCQAAQFKCLCWLPSGVSNSGVILQFRTGHIQNARPGDVRLQFSSNRLDHPHEYFPACVSAVERIKLGEVIQSAAVFESSAYA
jgi:hypothetical protein